MAGPALNPLAQKSAGQPSHESVDTPLEMQHELDVANDIRPAQRDTWRPGGNPGRSGAAMHAAGGVGLQAVDLGRRIVQRRKLRRMHRLAPSGRGPRWRHPTGSSRGNRRHVPDDGRARHDLRSARLRGVLRIRR